MIVYHTGSFGFTLLLRLHGSALFRSLPPALISSIVFILLLYTTDLETSKIFDHPYPMGALISALTFLLAFRANFSYNRYWEAFTSVHQMHSKWLDVGMDIAAFHLQSTYYEEKRPPSFGEHPTLTCLERQRERAEEISLLELSQRIDSIQQQQREEARVGASQSWQKLRVTKNLILSKSLFPLSIVTGDDNNNNNNNSDNNNSTTIANNEDIPKIESGNSEEWADETANRTKSVRFSTAATNAATADNEGPANANEENKPGSHQVENVPKTKSAISSGRSKKSPVMSSIVMLALQSKAMEADPSASGTTAASVSDAPADNDQDTTSSIISSTQLDSIKSTGSSSKKSTGSRAELSSLATISENVQLTDKLTRTATLRNVSQLWEDHERPLLLQEAAHLLSLLSAVALSTLRNDLEEAESPLISFTQGAPWPHVDPDSYHADVRKEWSQTSHMTWTALSYLFGFSRTPAARTLYNAARPFRVVGGVSDAEIEVLQAARGPYAKVTLCSLWLQEFVSREHLNGGLGAIAQPIIGRLFQFISDGMLAYNQARKVAYIPFPFPHAQITSLFVFVVVVLMPVLMLSYFSSEAYAFVANILTVMCFTGLDEVARELECPFQNAPNDVPLNNFQAQFNEGLMQMFAGFHPDSYWEVQKTDKRRQ